MNIRLITKKKNIGEMNDIILPRKNTIPISNSKKPRYIGFLEYLYNQSCTTQVDLSYFSVVLFFIKNRWELMIRYDARIIIGSQIIKSYGDLIIL